jgi:hypothetical protein
MQVAKRVWADDIHRPTIWTWWQCGALMAGMTSDICIKRNFRLAGHITVQLDARFRETRGEIMAKETVNISEVGKRIEAESEKKKAATHQ